MKVKGRTRCDCPNCIQTTDQFQPEKRKEYIDSTPQIKDWFCTVCGEKPSCKCEPPVPEPETSSEECPYGTCCKHQNEPEKCKDCEGISHVKSAGGIYCVCKCHKLSPAVVDPVEEKIKKILGQMPVLANVGFLEDALRALVALARKSR